MLVWFILPSNTSFRVPGDAHGIFFFLFWESEQEKEKENISVPKLPWRKKMMMEKKKEQSRWVIDIALYSSQWGMMESINKQKHSWKVSIHTLFLHSDNNINEIWHQMIGRICWEKKKRKKRKLLLLSSFCVHLQFLCIYVFVCSIGSCAPPLPPPPPQLFSPSVTSTAISEAAVEAALFWQILTLSKCISEDVMALVTRSPPSPLPFSLFPPFSSLLSNFQISIDLCLISVN